MRLQPCLLSDTIDKRMSRAERFGHRACRPVGLPRWLFRRGLVNDLGPEAFLFLAVLAALIAAPGTVLEKTFEAFFHVPVTPCCSSH